MTRTFLKSFAFAGIICFAIPVAAQIDYIGIHAQSMQTEEMYDKLFGDDSTSSRKSDRSLASQRMQSSPGWVAGSGGYLTHPVPRDAVSASLVYQSTPELRRDAAEAYIQRVTRSNPQAGAAIAKEIAKNDFSRIYAGIVKPFGYRADDAADAVAAYTLLGWLIATGAPDPRPDAARAVREQIAQGLIREGKFANLKTRAELGEEMKLLFLTLHAGWQSARREGNLQQYSDGVVAMFKRFSGNDLRALQLTDRGFVRRR